MNNLVVFNKQSFQMMMKQEPHSSDQSYSCQPMSSASSMDHGRQSSIDELLKIETKVKIPKTRGRYVTKLEATKKKERRKLQNRNAQRRSRQKKNEIVNKVAQFQKTISELQQQIKVSCVSTIRLIDS